MSEAQLTPNLVAGGDINPYRCVVVDTTDNTGIEAGTADSFVVGIADGSTKQFDSALHAESGDPVRLQTGKIHIAEAGGSITAGDAVATAADGQIVSAGSAGAGKMNVGIALEDAGGADVRIRIYFHPHANQA